MAHWPVFAVIAVVAVAVVVATAVAVVVVADAAAVFAVIYSRLLAYGHNNNERSEWRPPYSAQVCSSSSYLC